MNDVTKIREDLSYFFSKLNIAASPLDARAIQIMNDLFGVPSLIEENIMLKRQNELYRFLQDLPSFAVLDNMGRQALNIPWTDEEIEIFDRHNDLLTKVQQQTIEMAKERIESSKEQA